MISYINALINLFSNYFTNQTLIFDILLKSYNNYLILSRIRYIILHVSIIIEMGIIF